MLTPYLNRKLNRFYVYVDGRDVPFARHLMETHLGRQLAPGEVVHHINEDPTDDRIENLEVMSESEHKRMHARARRAADRATWTHEWTKSFAACVGCGSSDSPHAGRGYCRKCYWHHVRKVAA